ncbi:MAG: hypothetical protein Kow00109_25890 [Acidobacteriota bacterium]
MEESLGPISSPKAGEPEFLLPRLREFFDLFVLFHLGSNAFVDWHWNGQLLQVRVEHDRITPLQFHLDATQIEEFAASQETFETFLLQLLTRHRKS